MSEPRLEDCFIRDGQGYYIWYQGQKWWLLTEPRPEYDTVHHGYSYRDRLSVRMDLNLSLIHLRDDFVPPRMPVLVQDRFGLKESE